MLYAFAFERIGVVVGDLFFVDPRPTPGQEGAEQGVRLELRLVERGDLRGSVYSATPIAVERPVWRVDLLESVERPGSLDRAHHHPRFAGWEPGRRHFVEELTADPLGWLATRLGNLDGVLADAGVDADEVDAGDAGALRDAAPEIIAAVERSLERVRAAGHVNPPGTGGREQPLVRAGWL